MKKEVKLNGLQERYSVDVKQLMVSLVKNKIALGQKLLDAKQNLEHGQFLPMLDSLGMAQSTAKDYMALPKMKIVNNAEISAICLDNFNNSQLKKLDKMPEAEAVLIIKSGKFPKVEAPKKVIEAVIDVEVVDEDDKLAKAKARIEELENAIHTQMIAFSKRKLVPSTAIRGLVKTYSNPVKTINAKAEELFLTGKMKLKGRTFVLVEDSKGN